MAKKYSAARHNLESEDGWLKKKTAFLNRNLPGAIRQRVVNWFEKKDDILTRLAEYESLREDDYTATSERKRELIKELDTIESENSSLQDKLRDLHNELIQRRITARTHFKELDKIKGGYLQCAAEENDLAAEIRFMEEEKARMESMLKTRTASFDNNMAVLGKLIKDIKFVSGEIEMWTKKMVDLEEDVPRHFTEIDYLNERIAGAFTALTNLRNRLAAIDHNVKATYYTNK